MKIKNGLEKIIDFFQHQQQSIPGDYHYNAAFCRALVDAASAKEASIWQIDSKGQLHLIYGTNVMPEQIPDVSLGVGEGITGATALSGHVAAASNAWVDPQHDRRVDQRIDFRTRAMISAPVIFQNFLYGVINILNPVSLSHFPLEWQEYLSAVCTLYGASLASAGRLVPYPPHGSVKPEPGKSQNTRENTVIVGISRAIQEVLTLCYKAGRTHMPVLIHGETGTGKELAALKLHESSPVADGPFLAVNCSALAETLLESELFGHVKGAFSGAVKNRKGKFIAASGGTLFLDEIADMSLNNQAKILRVLQDKKVTPVGSEDPVDCNARIVAATNQNLWEKVKKGDFREDLFYRLCGIEILMPPLRERKDDIPLLSAYFLKKAFDEHGSDKAMARPPELSDNAAKMLEVYSWPGNVRQLEQAISASVAICDDDIILLDDFPAWLQNLFKTENSPTPAGFNPGEQSSVQNLQNSSEKEYTRYMAALERTKYPMTGRWNISKASRHLGIPRKTLIYRLKKSGLI
jgi:DNA-binding NtrC family response regulator